MSLKVLTEIAYDWGCRCFGVEHMNNKPIRALRFAEEAVELAQACGVPRKTMLECVHVVYERAPGNALQETGGSMVTLAILARLMHIDLEAAFEYEVRRCLSKAPEHFAQRNQDKIELGLTA